MEWPGFWTLHDTQAAHGLWAAHIKKKHSGHTGKRPVADFPFAPDARMAAILEKAAKIANAQMRVQSFADRRPQRIAWPGRKWE